MRFSTCSTEISLSQQDEHLLEPLGDDRNLEDRLPVGELDRRLRGDRIGELAVILDLIDRARPPRAMFLLNFT